MSPKKTLAVLIVLLAAVGIYWFGVAGRKPDAAAPGDTMAAFVVKKERPPVPDFSFADGSGAPLKISDWKGRVALVNLWATWCGPCRKEMPALAQLEKELGSKDFEVVAVSVDKKGAEASSAFLKEVGADNLKLYVDPSMAVYSSLQTIGLPTTLLIDRQGREIGRLIGPADWASPEAQALIKSAIAEKE
ncbi:TlpA family protein disulfide reductase [Aestuariivirga sp.]|uniref:TlpA family protein disulfide reductase n=1 Tax=Aestuariivirga sp. TaxID=2650926 RepID=UPI0039E66158